jgi:hypothetical protein
MPAVALAEPRTATGQFAPGHSGNPAGRPKGARNRATLAAAALLEENAEALLRTLIDGALGGNVAVARFLAGRLCPANAERTIALDVAPGREGDFLHVHALALRAMADGEITPKEALAVARFLTLGARLTRLQHPRVKAPARPAAPVSDQYSKAKSAASGCPLPSPPPRAGEGAKAPRSPAPACGGGPGRGRSGSAEESTAPLPRVYFSRDALRASTALGRVPALFPPLESRAACSTARAAA